MLVYTGPGMTPHGLRDDSHNNVVRFVTESQIRLFLNLHKIQIASALTE